MAKNTLLPWQQNRPLSKSDMEKITISAAEVAHTEPSLDLTNRLEPKLAAPVPTWTKIALSPLVLVLPLLCLVAIVVRVAMRNLPPRTRDAWTALLATLLTISGLITSVAAVLSVSLAPLPSLVGVGLSELDDRMDFPTLPTDAAMSAKEVSENLKPLVAVVSPPARSWFSHTEAPSASFGAGTLLQANTDGYLFVTARHVIDGVNWNTSRSGSRGLITMASGGWAAGDVIARHKTLDLLLLWVRRESGTSKFVQPLAKRSGSIEGEDIFVIGHPEGLRFTLSTGIISRTEGSTIQISAPVSPGNSGGPAFDSHGSLLGIVTSMVDKHGDPNAENLNFAVSSEALLRDDGWDYTSAGRKRLVDYIAQNERLEKTLSVQGRQ